MTIINQLQSLQKSLASPPPNTPSFYQSLSLTASINLLFSPNIPSSSVSSPSHLLHLESESSSLPALSSLLIPLSVLSFFHPCLAPSLCTTSSVQSSSLTILSQLFPLHIPTRLTSSALLVPSSYLFLQIRFSSSTIAAAPSHSTLSSITKLFLSCVLHLAHVLRFPPCSLTFHSPIPLGFFPIHLPTPLLSPTTNSLHSLALSCSSLPK